MLACCQDRTNTLVLSVASAWEMQIKSQLGKLTLNTSLDELIRRQQEINGMELLPVGINHVLALQDLPPHHRDPFDRILVAQANVERATLVTNDPIVAHVPGGSDLLIALLRRVAVLLDDTCPSGGRSRPAFRA